MKMVINGDFEVNKKAINKIKENYSIQCAKKKLLEQAIRDYNEKYNTFPNTLDDLVKTLTLQEIPTEPYGGFYFWDSVEKRVWSSKDAIGIEKLKNKTVLPHLSLDKPKY